MAVLLVVLLVMYVVGSWALTGHTCDFQESIVESLAAEVLRMALERLRGRKRELTQAAAQRLKSAHIRIGETGPVLSGGAFLIVRVRVGVRTCEV